jgi:hypothetical protein
MQTFIFVGIPIKIIFIYLKINTNGKITIISTIIDSGLIQGDEWSLSSQFYQGIRNKEKVN